MRTTWSVPASDLWCTTGFVDMVDWNQSSNFKSLRHLDDGETKIRRLLATRIFNSLVLDNVVRTLRGSSVNTEKSVEFSVDLEGVPFVPVDCMAIVFQLDRCQWPS